MRKEGSGEFRGIGDGCASVGVGTAATAGIASIQLGTKGRRAVSIPVFSFDATQALLESWYAEAIIWETRRDKRQKQREVVPR